MLLSARYGAEAVVEGGLRHTASTGSGIEQCMYRVDLLERGPALLGHVRAGRPRAFLHTLIRPGIRVAKGSVKVEVVGVEPVCASSS